MDLPLPLGPVRSAIWPGRRERSWLRAWVWRGEGALASAGVWVRPIPNLPQALRRRVEADWFPMLIRLMVRGMAALSCASGVGRMG